MLCFNQTLHHNNYNQYAEYKAYVMAFLDFLFFSMKISLIYDHKPQKYWQVVPRQRAEKGHCSFWVYVIMLSFNTLKHT